MVLPESKLKPYINLVCNFIFIFIVISPIVGFFSSDESFEDKILKSMTDYNEVIKIQLIITAILTQIVNTRAI